MYIHVLVAALLRVSSHPAMARHTGTHATETSPLLPDANHAQHQSGPPIDPGAGIAPEGAVPCDEHTPSGGSDEDGGDIERRASNGDTSKHQGMPEVKKRMKYIFPAIAIGVRPSPLKSTKGRQLTLRLRSSSPPRTKPS